MERILLSVLVMAVVGLAGCNNVGNRNVTQITTIVPVSAAQRPAAIPVPAIPVGGTLPCSEEARAESVAGRMLPVRYENDTSGTVSLFWLDPGGKRVPYGTIEAGKSMMRPGSPTSYWLVADAQQACIGIVHPGRETQAILIRGNATTAGQAELVASHTIALVVPGETERRLDTAFSLKPDCNPAGKTVGRIAERPTHGAAELRDVDDYPDFPPSDPRSACNKRMIPSVELWYRPEGSYAGEDSVSVDYIFASGTERFVSYLVTVK